MRTRASLPRIAIGSDVDAAEFTRQRDQDPANTTSIEGIGDEEIGRFRRAYAEGGLSGYWRRRLDYELRRAGGRPVNHSNSTSLRPK